VQLQHLPVKNQFHEKGSTVWVAKIFLRDIQKAVSLDSPPNVAIAPAISNTRKRMREDKRDSSGRKIVMVPSSEFLSKFVEWRKSRLQIQNSSLNFILNNN
jgi:hypothetical protein